MSAPEQDLIDQIDAFLRATDINATQFGIKAVGDGKLVSDLRRGRQLRNETRSKVVTYIVGEAGRRRAALDAVSPATNAQKRKAS